MSKTNALFLFFANFRTVLAFKEKEEFWKCQKHKRRAII
jgi:hypothetical protein